MSRFTREELELQNKKITRLQYLKALEKGFNPTFVAFLDDLKKGENVIVGVSVRKEYFWGQHLEAMLIALADAGLSLREVAFLVASDLQWHTHYMARMAKIDALVETLKAQIAKEDPNYVTTIESADLLDGHEELRQELVKTIQANGDWESVLDEGVKNICRALAKKNGEDWVNYANKTAAKLIKRGLLPNAAALHKRFASPAKRALRTFDWPILLRKPEYPEQRRVIDEMYAKNTEELADIIDEAANAFIDQYIEDNKTKYSLPAESDSSFPAFRKKLFERSIEYIKEESAVILMLMDEEAAKLKAKGLNAMVYPFQHNGTNNKLYDCIMKLSEVCRKQHESSATNLLRPAAIVYHPLEDVKGVNSVPGMVMGGLSSPPPQQQMPIMVTGGGHSAEPQVLSGSPPSETLLPIMSSMTSFLEQMKQTENLPPMMLLQAHMQLAQFMTTGVDYLKLQEQYQQSSHYHYGAPYTTSSRRESFSSSHSHGYRTRTPSPPPLDEDEYKGGGVFVMDEELHQQEARERHTPGTHRRTGSSSPRFFRQTATVNGVTTPAKKDPVRVADDTEYGVAHLSFMSPKSSGRKVGGTDNATQSDTDKQLGGKVFQ